MMKYSIALWDFLPPKSCASSCLYTTIVHSLRCLFALPFYSVPESLYQLRVSYLDTVQVACVRYPRCNGIRD